LCAAAAQKNVRRKNVLKLLTRPAVIGTCALVLATLSAGPVQAGARSSLWSADPRKGTGAFESIQCDTNTFTTTSDPAKGPVWQVKQLANQERCESEGPDVSRGSTYYLGWSSKFSITDSTSRYIFQLKCSPSTGTANHPIVLEVIGGEIQLQNWTHDHQKVLLWHTKAVNNQWNDYVLRVSEDQQKGTIQFWFNGARQKLATGSDTFTGTTYDGTRDYLKWGLYHPAPATATQWLSTIKMGTSLADVTG
jgi:hypothetical protein